MARIRTSLVLVLAAALSLVLAATGHARSGDVPVEPEFAYFQTLGKVVRAVPLRNGPANEKFQEGKAKGIVIKVSEDFHMTPEHEFWTLKTIRHPNKEDGSDTVCYRSDPECTLWIPDNWDPFPVPLDVSRTED